MIVTPAQEAVPEAVSTLGDLGTFNSSSFGTRLDRKAFPGLKEATHHFLAFWLRSTVISDLNPFKVASQPGLLEPGSYS